MKKLFLIVIAAFLFACSNNTDNDDNTDTLLLTKLIEVNDGNENVIEYTYNGNQLLELTNSAGLKTTYTYSNNKPSEVKVYDEDILVSKIIITYNDEGELSETLNYRYLSPSPITINDIYTFNGNTYTVENYVDDEFIRSYVYTLSDAGNILKQESNLGIIEYTYDEKKSPMSQIASADILYLLFMQGGPNNILSTQSNITGNNYSTSSSFTYNDEGYPETETYTNSGTTTERYYTYNN
ncbi:hypothetical protein [Flavobacterium rhizosphaerae]|uniref:YD repeat-containing protein n=1 Tax=Flavobacterium rhizosphaerae TaxID=3163298 RepID=A0ABW8Z0Z4_9FLAO